MTRSVCLIGAGSFGTAVVRVVGDNVARLSSSEEGWESTVRLWARREELAQSMQERRENEQYLPGARLPDNVVVSSDLGQVVDGASIIILAVPHQHLTSQMLQTIGEKCAQEELVHVVSLAKGLEFRDGALKRVSDLTLEGMSGKKDVQVSVLMGANVFDQMGRDEFAEATLGCPSADKQLLAVFDDPERFSVTMTSDLAGVECSGALKNVVALAAGYCEGLGLGSNTKAAIVRRGLLEIMRFSKTFYQDVKDDTFFESSGIADLMTTCFGGRGRRLAAEFVRCNQEKGWAQLEKEMLNGQQLPDWHNAQHVYHCLHSTNHLDDFPLFTAVYRIGFEKAPPTSIVDSLKKPRPPLEG